MNLLNLFIKFYLFYTVNTINNNKEIIEIFNNCNGKIIKHGYIFEINNKICSSIRLFN